MTLAKDASDGIDVVAKGIENVRKIVTAVRQGKDFVRAKHPDAKAHVAAIVAEMEKTLLFVERASALLPHLALTAKGETSVHRFNDHFQAHVGQATELEKSVDALRGRASEITKAATSIEGGAPAFAPIFEKLGLRSKPRETELGALLRDLASEGVASAESTILRALTASLAVIQNALGSPRVMSAANIPRASALVDEHAKAFEPLGARAKQVASDIHTVIAELTA